jgi:hypothetical protein
MADLPNKPSLAQFRQSIVANKAQNVSAVDVTEQTIEGQTAYVNVATMMSGGGLFNSGYRNIENATLEKENGKWRIISMPYAFWSYEWNQPESIK